MQATVTLADHKVPMRPDPLVVVGHQDRLEVIAQHQAWGMRLWVASSRAMVAHSRHSLVLVVVMHRVVLIFKMIYVI